MNLFQLSVSQRLLMLRLGDIGVVLHLEIEDVATVGFGAAERGEEEGGLEVLLAGEQLDWEVFLCLS